MSNVKIKEIRNDVIDIAVSADLLEARASAIGRDDMANKFKCIFEIAIEIRKLIDSE